MKARGNKRLEQVPETIMNEVLGRLSTIFDLNMGTVRKRMISYIKIAVAPPFWRFPKAMWLNRIFGDMSCYNHWNGSLWWFSLIIFKSVITG